MCLLGVQVAVEGEGWLRFNMIMAYFERKGCVRNPYLNCVSLSVSSACNRRRHWSECVGRVNRTFRFTGTITGRSCS